MLFGTRRRTLDAALPVVVPLIGKRFGVPVRMEGQTARTNGRTITIPAIDPEDENLARTIVGFLVHEAGHIRCTDFSVLEEIDPTNGIRRRLMNVIEDVRVEADAIAEYRGAAAYLAAVARWLIDAGMYDIPSTEAPNELLVEYVDRKLRVTVLQETGLLDQLEVAERRMQEAFPEAVLIRLNGLLSMVPEFTTSTHLALALVDEILAKLKEEQDREEARQQAAERSDPEPDGRESGDSNGSDAGDGSADPGTGGEPDGNAGQDTASSDGNGDGGSQSPTLDSSPNMSASASDKDASSNGNPTDSAHGDHHGDHHGGQDGAMQTVSTSDTQRKLENLRASLNAGDDEFGRDAREQLAEIINKSVEEEKETHPSSVAGMVSPADPYQGAGNLAGGQHRHTKVRGTSNQVRARLRGLVQSDLHVRDMPSRRGRKIDTRRLVRVSRGDCRIFLQHEQRQRPNTAVHLLLDRSESMRLGSKLDIALDAVLALALALEEIQGVSLAATAFPGQQGGQTVQPMLLRGRKVRGDLGQFAMSVAGSTPLAEAMWHVAADLAQAKEPRRVLIVATDGRPNSPEAAHYVIDRFRRAGIEVIGIGIGTDSLEDLFPISAVIRDVSDLRDALFDIARKVIVLA